MNINVSLSDACELFKLQLKNIAGSLIHVRAAYKVLKVFVVVVVFVSAEITCM